MISNKILGRPSPRLKTLFFTKYKENHFLNDLIYFPLGRDALVVALKLLNIKNNAAIIIPAYMCESSITPLRQEGYKIIFVDIDNNLNLSKKIVLSTIKKYNVKAILAVHYFGLPNNIEELVEICSSSKIRLIEDCSHSLLTSINGQNVGTIGDAAIYSMRKTLPIYDGGALRINKPINNNYKLVFKRQTIINDFFYLMKRLAEHIVFKYFLINIYSEKIENYKNYFIKDKKLNIQKDKKYLSKPIDPSFQLKKYIHDRDYLSNLKRKVQFNYNYIISKVIDLGYEPLCLNLPVGCIPQWAIIYDRKGNIVEKMREMGVGAIRWPWYEIPKEVNNNNEYSVANYFNKHLVLLPIHQSIGNKELFKILEALKLIS